MNEIGKNIIWSLYFNKIRTANKLLVQYFDYKMKDKKNRFWFFFWMNCIKELQPNDEAKNGHLHYILQYFRTCNGLCECFYIKSLHKQILVHQSTGTVCKCQWKIYNVHFNVSHSTFYEKIFSIRWTISYHALNMD